MIEKWNFLRQEKYCTIAISKCKSQMRLKMELTDAMCRCKNMQLSFLTIVLTAFYAIWHAFEKPMFFDQCYNRKLLYSCAVNMRISLVISKRMYKHEIELIFKGQRFKKAGTFSHKFLWIETNTSIQIIISMILISNLHIFSYIGIFISN